MCDHRNSAPHCSSPFFLGNYSDVRRDYRIGHCLYPTCSIAVMGLGFWFKVSVVLRPLLTATLKDVVARRPVAATIRLTVPASSARPAPPVAATIRLTVPAGGARPAPPVGPALRQYHLNMMAFCKDFNARTQKYKPDTPMAANITAYKDNTFEFTVKTPSVTWFLKQATGVEFGSRRRNLPNPSPHLRDSQDQAD
ncbi:54S ribosomal protein L19, mitochondrial [Canna indica]|uniref:Large ribosomal subunit protein uL11m n=1 Tax=Canna indica TaxID=4628 RepID=A0AAQ3KTZ4_9LILI|nr:54S ribosomal protein L19, mitochondrial [Canna indica]